MKAFQALVYLLLFFFISCSQQLATNKSDNPLSIDRIAKDLPPELIQQYVLAYVDTTKQSVYTLNSGIKTSHQEIKDLYRYNQYNLFWTTLTAPNTDAKNLLNGLSESFEHGLNPNHYLTDSLLEEFETTYAYNQEINILDLIQLDVKLSSAYLTFTSDLHHGQINPLLLGEEWQLSKKHTELAPYLAGKSFKEGVKMISPKSQKYLALQKKLKSYIALENEGGWPNIPDSMRVALDESNPAIHLLRDRLYYSGDYSKGLATTSRGLTFDKDLKNALITFQARHGLKPDGVLTPETINALNIPIEHRIDQIKINMERLKWLPEQENERTIVANIPDFTLTLYRKSKEVKSFKIIVGKESSRTPILKSKVEYIRFSPSWFVPNISFNRHILPKVKKDPNYLDKLGYKLYAKNDLKGENPIDSESVKWSEIDVINSKFKALHTPNVEDGMLGKIKFGMPNKEGLFICDAVNPALFNFSFRAFNFSSISVENPELLAKYLLNDKHWDIMTIQEKMANSRPESIPISDVVTVNIVYLTAWVNDKGQLQFRNDIYGYDTLHAELLHLENERWNQE